MSRERYGIFGGAAALLCLAALLGGGCATGSAVRTSGSNLTYEALRDGGIAIVSVTVKEEVEQVRPPLNATLERVLREMRPDLRVQAADATRESLGLPEYRRLLAAYQLKGNLAAADRNALASRLRGGVRFALLALVDKDDIRLPPNRTSSSLRYGAASPSFGTQTAIRDARIRMTLYDLETGAEAWSAVYTSSTDNAPADSVSRPPVVLGLPLLTVPSEGRFEPLPERPSLAQALIEGLRDFAADLPMPPPQPAAAKR